MTRIWFDCTTCGEQQVEVSVDSVVIGFDGGLISPHPCEDVQLSQRAMRILVAAGVENMYDISERLLEEQ